MGAKILTTLEVAEMLRVTPKTVREMAQDGRLRSFRIGKLYRFDSQEVHKLFLSPQDRKGQSGSLKTEKDFKLVSLQPNKKGGPEWL